jgi:hypothetical protein
MLVLQKNEWEGTYQNHWWFRLSGVELLYQSCQFMAINEVRRNVLWAILLAHRKIIKESRSAKYCQEKRLDLS